VKRGNNLLGDGEQLTCVSLPDMEQLMKLSPKLLISLAALAVLGTFLLPVGAYWTHLESQRRLQQKIEDSGEYFFNGSDHWLGKWLPKPLAKRLPQECLDVHVMFEGLEAFRQDSARLDGVQKLSFSSVEFDSLRELVRPHRGLEYLSIEESVLPDDEFAALADQPHLERIRLKDVPVTDACLVHLGAMPALRQLDLYETRVIRPAALAFAAAHPVVYIGWTPRLSSQLLELLRALS
jgi:hypothetical protein